ncbi:MAG TPA: cytochrome C, partial [Anaerolineae bacterium]|nr:cytochrome C [Anaerolineae bacterium]HIQ06514.1 cytochrome C [Anaerolineae bacterium]
MSKGFLRLSHNHGGFYLFATIAVVVIGLGLFSGGVTVWEYTNSSQFCGTTCHAMPPEYTAYQVSPHARVACVDCHLGQDSVLNTVPRKAKEVRHVVFALTQNYDTPIYVKSLRPARDTCEKCHYPEKFSTDSVKGIRRYAKDEKNSETRIYLILKTGGGSKREGLGKGIHWHIESEVWYIATDKHKQEIPYVRQVDDDGRVTEYFDVSLDLPPDFVAQNSDKLRRMDCIDCHNRISHQFRSPDRALDQALARRLIDRDIPYIKLWGTDLLSSSYLSHDEAMAAIE